MRPLRSIKKAAEQKRHVMLIGEPGTGKSMLAKSMTEYLPRGDLQDVIAYHNPEDPNEPKIRVVPAGKGKEIVGAQKREAMQRKQQKASMLTLVIFMVLILSVALYLTSPSPHRSFDNFDRDRGGSDTILCDEVLREQAGKLSGTEIAGNP